MYHYSAETQGFYLDEIHGDAIPVDAIPLTEDQYNGLLAGQREGKVITVTDDGVSVQDLPHEELDVEKKMAINRINRDFEKAVSSLSEDYPMAESQTFYKQEVEARKFVESEGSASVPLLESIASSRGVEVEWLARKVISKSDEYDIAIGNLSGVRQRLVKSIQSASDVDEVISVKWEE